MIDEGDRRAFADPGREQDASRLFPFTSMSPEEYAAREGVNWLCFSFADFRYRDPVLDAWIQTLGRIFTTPGKLKECQQAWLTPAELAKARRRASGEL